ncbi:MAG: FAD-binding protein [Syntrophomonadaceae bacterium]|nr:FAD-binding protein [Syntrophomonadaceae bacterium]
MKSLHQDLIRLLSDKQVLTQPEDLMAYASDATYYYASRVPDAVVLPVTSEEVARVMKYAYEKEIPVTPRGAGSGLAGGCTPINGGIVLDMKRMNRLLEIDHDNMTAEVEAGLVHRQFTRAVERQGLFYPPDPQSAAVCTLGGNIATRAGGPRGVKYGTTGNYVLGTEVVLADGSIIKTGGKMVKQSSGYDITHLIAGSEGTLGIITRANLRLLTLPPVNNTMVISCSSLDQAAELVSAIIASGTVPAMLEFLIKLAIMVMNNYITPPLPLDYEAYLLVDVDGTARQVQEDTKKIKDICQDLGIPDLRIIEDPHEAASYWEARSKLYPLMLSIMKRVITEDITVPRNRIPDFVRGVQAIAADIAIQIGLAGHSGDGNMHPTILQPEINDEINAKAKQAIDRIIRIGLDLGGTISGEHGIGLHKQEYLEWEFGRTQVELMKRIKTAFDPKGLLNPGKIWLEGGDAE